ncbi:uncharacterized protein LOC129770176 [Toxorhynchites rutilus septentrionalis]|uniref:uncharacterized protein LOC129770176 n=1 Tax=Toxorhynchites rutilus septentrionalis TaxID=329112 RepID=UPI00247A666B|nr:uncharacterized protein LOC129770176 [Toxorhynchites rutilus septentrionalis]
MYLSSLLVLLLPAVLSDITSELLDQATIIYHVKPDTYRRLTFSGFTSELQRKYCAGFHIGSHHFVTGAHCLVSKDGTIHRPYELDILGLGVTQVEILMHRRFDGIKGADIAWIKTDLSLDVNHLIWVAERLPKHCKDFRLDVFNANAKGLRSGYRWISQHAARKQMLEIQTKRPAVTAFRYHNVLPNAEVVTFCTTKKDPKRYELHYVYLGISGKLMFQTDCHYVHCWRIDPGNLKPPPVAISETTTVAVTTVKATTTTIYAQTAVNVTSAVNKPPIFHLDPNFVNAGPVCVDSGANLVTSVPNTVNSDSHSAIEDLNDESQNFINKDLELLQSDADDDDDGSGSDTDTSSDTAQKPDDDKDDDDENDSDIDDDDDHYHSDYFVSDHSWLQFWEPQVPAALHGRSFKLEEKTEDESIEQEPSTQAPNDVHPTTDQTPQVDPYVTITSKPENVASIEQKPVTQTPNEVHPTTNQTPQVDPNVTITSRPENVEAGNQTAAKPNDTLLSIDPPVVVDQNQDQLEPDGEGSENDGKDVIVGFKWPPTFSDRDGLADFDPRAVLDKNRAHYGSDFTPNVVPCDWKHWDDESNHQQRSDVRKTTATAIEITQNTPQREDISASAGNCGFAKNLIFTVTIVALEYYNLAHVS